VVSPFFLNSDFEVQFTQSDLSDEDKEESSNIDDNTSVSYYRLCMAVIPIDVFFPSLSSKHVKNFIKVSQIFWLVCSDPHTSH